jgi:phage-related protein (TIGR01555 family)
MAERKRIDPTARAVMLGMDDTKPRIRVQAGSSEGGKRYTGDSFQNFRANLGLGTNNLTTGSTYGFFPLSRNRVQLEWMYRGSWLVRKIVDVPADDMTRAGISFTAGDDPDKGAEMIKGMRNMALWKKLNSTIKWSRLYGGAMAYIMIDGQDPITPLRLETVGKGQFKGLVVLDRWTTWPVLSLLVQDAGPSFGQAEYYDVVADGMGLPRGRIHHSRMIRFDGVELPYWSRMQENGWGISVIEPLYDRLIAFDSSTTGAAQLVYKAHLRTYKIPGLRELVAAGGPLYQAVLEQIALMRAMQANEGITLMDGEDEFEAYSYTFAGLSDMLIQFAQQLSGGADIPLTRLYGQSPAGLNATGDSDLRNYYDMINAQQESRLRLPVQLVLELVHRTLFGQPLPDDFDFEFNSLWQMSEVEKAQAALNVAQAVTEVQDMISPQTALKELKQSSRETGMFSNITDKEIDNAEELPPEPPDPGDLEGMGLSGIGGGGKPGVSPGIPPKPGAKLNGASRPARPAADRKRIDDRARWFLSAA